MAAYEIEMKFPVGSFDAFAETAASIGAEFGTECTQSDRYFNHPVRDFAATDEALRVRTIGDRSRVTYKGPRLDAKVKLREEIEMQVGVDASDGGHFAEMLQALGFREVRTVTKRRRSAQIQWQGRAFELTLDDVDQVGRFVEVETLAGESATDEAREAVLELSRQLGLTDPEPRSYLQLLIDSE